MGSSVTNAPHRIVCMVAAIQRAGSEDDAIDLFAGFGGSSQGIKKAGATIRAAANHKALAVQCHAANFPEADHFIGDLVDATSANYVDPAQLPAAAFCWASPSCTSHSKALAKRLYAQGVESLFSDERFDYAEFLRQERSRVTMSSVLRYAAARRPRICVVENVVTVAFWGPGGDGSTFRWWLGEWRKLGYRSQLLWLNAMFFPPCPQSRDRFYGVFCAPGVPMPDLAHRPRALCTSTACGGKLVDALQRFKEPKRTWPLAEWGSYGAQYLYRCPDCGAEVHPAAWPAYTAIDWSHLGTPIGARAEVGMRPLAPATLERIRRAVRKFRGVPPLVIPLAAEGGARIGQALGAASASVVVGAGNGFERPGSACRSRSVASALFTQHTSDAMGVALEAPSVVELRGGGSVAAGQRSVADVLRVVSAGGEHHGLVVASAAFTKQNGGPSDTAWHEVTDPLGTVTARDTTALVVLPCLEQWRSQPTLVTDQMATITTHLRHSLVVAAPERTGEVSDEELGSVRFRMLEPEPEIKRAMAFGDDYRLLGTRRDRIAGLGNAVVPSVAEWITGRCMAVLRGEAA